MSPDMPEPATPERELTDEEIRVVFEKLDLPLAAPKPPAPEPVPLVFFPISGSSAPGDSGY